MDGSTDCRLFTWDAETDSIGYFHFGLGLSDVQENEWRQNPEADNRLGLQTNTCHAVVYYKMLHNECNTLL